MFVLLAALLHYDVLVSAGHEGRPQSCAVYHRACNMGAQGELQWNTIVADDLTRILRARGLRVAREPADFAGTFAVKSAVFIHFDGAVPACSSGASVGYHTPQSGKLADRWKAVYGRAIPFRFMPDNFTVGLRDYYAYRQVRATRGAFVAELGEIDCTAQREWLAPRLQRIAGMLAQVLTGG